VDCRDMVCFSFSMRYKHPYRQTFFPRDAGVTSTPAPSAAKDDTIAVG
jgi:hypothetical protein